jgi:hypothetical protein
VQFCKFLDSLFPGLLMKSFPTPGDKTFTQ